MKHIAFTVIEKPSYFHGGGKFFFIRDKRKRKLYLRELELHHFFNWQNLYIRFTTWFCWKRLFPQEVTVRIYRNGKLYDKGIITDRRIRKQPPWPQLLGFKKFRERHKPDPRWNLIIKTLFSADEFESGDVIRIRTNVYNAQEFLDIQDYFGPSRKIHEKPSGNEKIYLKYSTHLAKHKLVKDMELRREKSREAWDHGYIVA